MRDPKEMTPEARFAEVAELLARGLLRSRGKRVPAAGATPADDGQTSAPHASARMSRPPLAVLESRTKSFNPAARQRADRRPLGEGR